MANKIIKEHKWIDKKIINPKKDFVNKGFDPNAKTYGYKITIGEKNEPRFFFCLDKEEISDDDGKIIGYEDRYKASYYIGAQWVKTLNKNNEIDKSIPIVITPKFENIDYSNIFMSCLQSGLESEAFSRLYEIDFESKDGYINAPSVNSAFNPLLISHFLFLVEKVVEKGLKKDYIYFSDNLKKPKGHINIRKNEIKNVIPKRYDRTYCDYSDYSIDIPENRIIKKALLFVKKCYDL